MTAETIDGQMDLLELLAPAPEPSSDLPPLQRVRRPLTKLQDYSERYPHWLRIGERCPACGFHFDYPQDASNNHSVPFDADPSAPVCTAMYLTRNHVTGAVRRGDLAAMREDIRRADRWWSTRRLSQWLPALLTQHGYEPADFMPTPDITAEDDDPISYFYPTPKD